MLTWLRQPTHFILVLLACIPIALAAQFTWRHAPNVPFADQWCDSVPAILQAGDGDLTPTRLFAQHNAHRIFLATASDVVFYYLTGWNTRAQMSVTFLMLIATTGLSVALAVQLGGLRGVVPGLVLVVMAVLLFSVRQRVLWLWPYASPYVTPYLLLLLAVFVLINLRPKWLALGVATLIAFISAYSIITGFLVWGVLGLLLWFLGYRALAYHVAWWGGLALGFGLFFVGYNTDPTNFCDGYELGQTVNAGLFASLSLLPDYIARSVGATVLADPQRDWSASLWVGSAVLGLVLVNVVYFVRWARQHATASQRQFSLILLSLALVALASIAMTAVGRDMAPIRAVFLTAYIIQGTHLLAFMAILVIWTSALVLEHASGLWRSLLYVNLIGMASLGWLHLTATIESSNFERYPLNHIGYYHPTYELQVCLRNHFFVDDDCLQLGDTVADDTVEQLALRRLTAFRGINFVVVNDYDDTLPVMVYSPLAAQQLRVRAESGGMVSEENVWRVLPSQEADKLRDGAIQNTVPVSAGVPPADLPTPSSPFWYFGVDDDYGESLRQTFMQDHGIIWEETELYEAPVSREPHELSPVAYGTRRPDTPTQELVFGDLFLLDQWVLRTPVTVSACDVIQFESWWALLEDAPENHSMALVLADTVGMGIAQDNRQLGTGLPTRVWQVDQTYWSARRVVVPCDTAPGEYVLLLSVKDRDGDLAAATSEDAPLNNQVYLTTIFVED